MFLIGTYAQFLVGDIPCAARFMLTQPYSVLLLICTLVRLARVWAKFFAADVQINGTVLSSSKSPVETWLTRHHKLFTSGKLVCASLCSTAVFFAVGPLPGYLVASHNGACDPALAVSASVYAVFAGKNL